MGNLDMWFTYPAEDTLLAHILHLLEEDHMIHHIPVRRTQATDLLSEVHRPGMEGFGEGGVGGKVVTHWQVMTDATSCRGSGLPFPDHETSAAPLFHPPGRTIAQSPFQN
jgi:hypothetical protein